ncbi:hypothetical protein ACHWQZ_G005509 [Mnemiopsis leidyi]
MSLLLILVLLKSRPTRPEQDTDSYEVSTVAASVPTVAASDPSVAASNPTVAASVATVSTIRTSSPSAKDLSDRVWQGFNEGHTFPENTVIEQYFIDQTCGGDYEYSIFLFSDKEGSERTEIKVHVKPNEKKIQGFVNCTRKREGSDVWEGLGSEQFRLSTHTCKQNDFVLAIEKGITGYKIELEESTLENSSIRINFPAERKECTTPTRHAEANGSLSNWFVSELEGCWGLYPTWEHAYTFTQFPVLAGTILTVFCVSGSVNLGSSYVTCVGGTGFEVGGRPPKCHRIGKFLGII